jgi:ABC-type uncharacterized transport system permease subunit
MSENLLLLAIVGYTVAIALTTVVTVYRSAAARRAASVAYLATWALHLAALVHEAMLSGSPAPSNLHEFLLVLGSVIISMHLYVWFRLKVYAAGLVLPPIAAMSAAGAQSLGGSSRPRTGGASGWFLFHTTVSTLGLAILCLAFAMAAIYLLQDRALKLRRTLRWLQRLPALDTCDKVGFQALLLGFFLLTLGIATGLVVNEALYDTLRIRGAKQVFPVLAWLVFAVVLISRVGLGVRGRRSALLTIAGFVLGLLTVVGMTI